MSEEQPGTGSETDRRLAELSAQVAANQAAILALQSRADSSNHRADASDERASAQGVRMDELEARIDLDREVIAQLQADGLLSEQHAAHMEHALRSSRRIGAAIGIIMADRQVGEAEAFVVLSRASQHSNRKLRLLAEDLVSKGDVSGIPGL